MKLLGFLSIVFGIVKLVLCLSDNDKMEKEISSLLEDTRIYKYLIGILITDGVVGIICGLFIMIL